MLRERWSACESSFCAPQVRVLMLIAGLDVRIVSEEGELVRELTLDPTKSYQGLGNGKGARMS